MLKRNLNPFGTLRMWQTQSEYHYAYILHDMFYTYINYYNYSINYNMIYNCSPWSLLRFFLHSKSTFVFFSNSSNPERAFCHPNLDIAKDTLPAEMNMQLLRNHTETMVEKIWKSSGETSIFDPKKDMVRNDLRTNHVNMVLETRLVKEIKTLCCYSMNQRKISYYGIILG